MYYVVIRHELSTSKYDGIDFELFKKFDPFDCAVEYAVNTCRWLSGYPMCVCYEILKSVTDD